MEKIIDGEKLNIPEHVAIIMDGNGRWAKKRLMPRNFGHKQGAKVVEQICEDAHSLGIKYLTVYAFSTENWKRSVEEVSGIMNLLRNYLVDSIERASKNNMRVRIIGDRTALDKDIVEKIEELEEKTKGYDGLTFTIALNYGGRDELRRSIQAIAADVKADKLSLSDIDEKLIGSYLDTDGIPDPDLMIRTSGEVRLSNYLIWQLAYSEFCFMDVLWPDFTIEHLKDAIRYYNKKERRFGGVK
ncbi:MAG: isoprenyl transferase [Lachnospiraceae bacterium]|nr:isoprenyl transferase [Lachnospiraceae bacterium]